MSSIEISALTARIRDSVILRDINLNIQSGESVAIIGASGVGKSTLLKLMVGALPKDFDVMGSVDVVSKGTESRIGYVPQDARGSLDPLWRVGFQLREVIRSRTSMTRTQANKHTYQLLQRVGFSDPRTIARQFPHQLSGGMCQRIALAMALAHDPDVLLIDEPASMLDALSASELLDFIALQHRELGCTLVVITHDMGVAHRLCDSWFEMRDGALLPIPRMSMEPEINPKSANTASDELVVDVRRLVGGYGKKPILDDVDLQVFRGETLAIVGRSGCGKSTLLRFLLGELESQSGVVEVFESNVLHLSKAQLRMLRTQIGVVFQDPWASLDPRLTIRESIADFARSGDDNALALAESLKLAGLDSRLEDRYPAQLSGGQLQRACIARAVVRRPKLLVLDEPTSALDSHLRTGVIETIEALVSTADTTCVLVSHDLKSVAEIADRIVVMDAGRVVEAGPAAQILGQPTHPATKALLTVSI